MIAAILLTAIVYLTLQRIDENRRIKNCLPPPTLGSRIGLLFFVSIVCFVVLFLLQNMSNDTETGKTNVYVEGGSYEDDMLGSIHGPIHVGVPPF